MKFANRYKGQKGENLAKDYLKSKKYKILEQNYSNFCGEIDIIALINECVVFVEVKKRDDLRFGRPCEAVDKFKQQKIKKTAMVYLKQHKKLDCQIRFDVIEIFGDEINHIINAF